MTKREREARFGREYGYSVFLYLLDNGFFNGIKNYKWETLEFPGLYYLKVSTDNGSHYAYCIPKRDAFSVAERKAISALLDACIGKSDCVAAAW